MKLFDAHAHLTDEQFADDLDEVIKNFEDAEVEGVISAAYDFSSSQEAVALAGKRKNVFATVGIHPENVVSDFCDEKFLKVVVESGKIEEEFKNFEENFENMLEKLEKVAKNEKVVAIGEIGLDYHFFDNNSDEEIAFMKKMQKFAFEKQIQLAKKLNLPIVVHSRDAMGDTLDVLRKNSLARHSLLHCYGGSLESAKELMKLGYSFSFGGVVTFKNAKNVQEVVANLPLERILLETDCPYMSPEPFRGKRNEPKNLVYVADKIARLKNLTIEEVANQTTQNAKKLFGLKL